LRIEAAARAEVQPPPDFPGTLGPGGWWSGAIHGKTEAGGQRWTHAFMHEFHRSSQTRKQYSAHLGSSEGHWGADTPPGSWHSQALAALIAGYRLMQPAQAAQYH